MKGNVFIVGGTGYIGYHIAQEFNKRDYGVTALSFDDVEKGFLPETIKVIKADINKLSDLETTNLMSGHDIFVFAAGLDDRFTPKAPAFPAFYKANVESVKRLLLIARQLNYKKAIIMNSYFAYFDRVWPEMKLAEKHPYIRSRKLQRETAFDVAGPEMPVAVIELPYIVGTTPTKGSLWKVLVKYINGKKSVYYTKGGTAVVSVRNVAEAVVNAVERTIKNSTYQIVDKNMTWEEWLRALRPDKSVELKIKYAPTWVLKVAAFFLKLKHKLQGKESGLDLVRFIDLQTRLTYLPVNESKNELGYGSYNFDEDMERTVKLCLDLLDKDKGKKI
jgi:dihydroflavonol-4-reductase